MTHRPDIVLEISEAFSQCYCGARVRLYREADGDLTFSHSGGKGRDCVHRNAIILGLTQTTANHYLN